MTIYAVNGKEPIAAWIPSLDTAGNGTTTLTDLVGTNNGTLTNMDAATDWVADTGAGGVRALDFDDSNDFVSLPSTQLLPSSGGLAISWWEKPASGTGTYRSRLRFNAGEHGWLLLRSNDPSYGTLSFGRANTVSVVRAFPVSLGDSVGVWKHFLIVGINGAVSTSPSDWLVYEDGVLITTSQSNTFSFFATDVNRIGSDGIAFTANCLMGDIRIWDQSLDATDVSYLYNSGNGRGRVSTIRRQQRSQQIIS